MPRSTQRCRRPAPQNRQRLDPPATGGVPGTTAVPLTPEELFIDRSRRPQVPQLLDPRECPGLERLRGQVDFLEERAQLPGAARGVVHGREPRQNGANLIERNPIAALVPVAGPD